MPYLFLFFVLLIPALPSNAIASVTPEHVTCEITGTIIDKKTTNHIDRFMGGEQKRKTYDLDVKISVSKTVKEASEGKCPPINEITTFSFQTPLDRFKFKKDHCIKGTSQFGGSTTFNANWIGDIQKLPVEKCAQ